MKDLKHTKAIKSQDEVLFAFIDACPLPSTEDIESWQRIYTEHAPAIRQCANFLLEAAFSRPEFRVLISAEI